MARGALGALDRLYPTCVEIRYVMPWRVVWGTAFQPRGHILSPIFQQEYTTLLLLFLNSLAPSFSTNMLSLHNFDVCVFVQVKVEALFALLT